jgi:hypothetical protein
MSRTSSTSERDASAIPDTVRCRPDPDGIVVWLPADDEPQGSAGGPEALDADPVGRETGADQ